MYQQSRAEVPVGDRSFARNAKLRWLGGQRGEIANWDCYEAPAGESFTDAVQNGLPWRIALLSLTQFAEELISRREENFRRRKKTVL